MAQGVDFPQANDWMGKPENMSNNQCYALPICRFITVIPGVIPRAPLQRVWAHVSFWQLSDEEVEEVIRSRGVYLKIIGTSMFPTSIHGINPISPGEAPLADIVFTREQIEEARKPRPADDETI